MVHEIELTVRYAETDQMGIAYHAAYLVWFDMARTSYLGAIGYRYRDLEREGFFFAVIEANTRYRKPAKFDDTLRVKVWASELRRFKLQFSYKLYRMPDPADTAGAASSEPELLAEGTTVLACIDPKGKAQLIPPKVAERVVVLAEAPR